MTELLDITMVGGQAIQKRLDQVQANAPKVADNMAEGMARVYERGMKRRCPVGRTGATRGSIHVLKPEEAERTVGPNSVHAMFLEFGTGLHTEYEGAVPHRIKPIHGKFLAWTSYSGRGLKGGTSVVVRSTAGMHAQPFVRPTYHEDTPAAVRSGNMQGKLTLLKGLK